MTRRPGASSATMGEPPVRSSGVARVLRIAAAILLIAHGSVFLMVRPARAQVACNLSMPSAAFGTISATAGYPYSTSGTASVSCINNTASNQAVYGCVSIGVGTGGQSASNRTMAAGANLLPIQITGGASHPSQVGDNSVYTMDGPFSLTVAGSGGFSSRSFPIVVSIPQPGTPPNGGNYTTTFSGSSSTLYYTYTSAPTDCSTATSAPYSSTSSFNVTATVPIMCSVAATSMAFPTSSVLTAAKTATATITTTCNASTPVTVSLDNGANGSAPAARKMKSGAATITYGIYQDSAHATIWGSTAGTNTAAISGSGTLTVYGLVPAQTTPAPGSYSDVVNVTITY